MILLISCVFVLNMHDLKIKIKTPDSSLPSVHTNPVALMKMCKIRVYSSDMILEVTGICLISVPGIQLCKDKYALFFISNLLMFYNDRPQVTSIPCQHCYHDLTYKTQ